jgi:hypothetical protein
MWHLSVVMVVVRKCHDPSNIVVSRVTPLGRLNTAHDLGPYPGMFA